MSGADTPGQCWSSYAKPRICRVKRSDIAEGFLSQKATGPLRLGSRIYPLLSWILILPLRPLLPMLDRILGRRFDWPLFSICLEAQKPRFSSSSPDQASRP